MLIAGLAYLGFIVGIILMLVGRHGRRVDDHPTCRRCRFDLVGKPAESGRCSECGAELSGPEAVLIGNRERRQVPFVVGAFLLVLCGFTAVGLTFLLAGPVSYSPTWYLLSQAQRGDGAQKAIAFRELEARVIRPSAGSIVDRALAVQADAATRWDERWGDLVENAQRAGTAAPAQWENYLGHIVLFEEQVRPRVALNEGILIVIINSAELRRGVTAGSALNVRVDTTFSLHCDGITASIPGPYIEIGGESYFNGPQKNRFPLPDTDRLGPGIKHVTIEHSWDAVGLGPLGGTGHGSQKHVLDLTILPEGIPSVQVVPRPDLDKAVEQSLYEPQNSNREEWKIRPGNVQIEANRPPMDLAFHAYLVTGGKEFVLGDYVFRKGWDSEFATGIEVPQDIPAGPAEIILRPAPEAATDTPDIFEIYGGEVRKPVQLIRN